jgi:DNA-directed RNA polymerase specialized sigma24 family protein
VVRRAMTMSKRWDPAVITDDGGHFSLDVVWPEVSRRLHGFLISSGVDHHTREDITQEVAARALSREVPFTDVDQLTRWSCTVAKNLVVDDWRARGRTSVIDVVPERIASVDTEALVEQRSCLRAVLAGVASLSALDRNAIESAVVGRESGDRRDSVRMAVRRHRARARLLHLVEGALGILGWIFGARRLLRMPVVAPTTVATAAVVVVSLVLLVPRTPATAPGVSAASPPFRSTEVLAEPAPASLVHAAPPRVATPVHVMPAPAPPKASPHPTAKSVPPSALHGEIRADTPVRPIREEVREKREGEHVLCVRLEQTLPQSPPVCVG